MLFPFTCGGRYVSATLEALVDLQDRLNASLVPHAAQLLGKYCAGTNRARCCLRAPVVLVPEVWHKTKLFDIPADAPKTMVLGKVEAHP